MSRDVPAAHVGRVLASFVPGFLAQRALLGDVDAAMFQNGLHALLEFRSNTPSSNSAANGHKRR